MSNIDRFYPLSDTMNGGGGLWQVGMQAKLITHLGNARLGDRASESKLINRLGQMRRCVRLEELAAGLREVIEESVVFLRSTGRRVDFGNPDPALWITARDGRSPRW